MGDLLASLKKQLASLVAGPDNGFQAMIDQLDLPQYPGLLTLLTATLVNETLALNPTSKGPLHRQMARALEALEEKRNLVAHVKDIFGETPPFLTTINRMSTEELKELVTCDDLGPRDLQDLHQLIDVLAVVRARTHLPWICELRN